MTDHSSGVDPFSSFGSTAAFAASSALTISMRVPGGSVVHIVTALISTGELIESFESGLIPICRNSVTASRLPSFTAWLNASPVYS